MPVDETAYNETSHQDLCLSSLTILICHHVVYYFLSDFYLLPFWRLLTSPNSKIEEFTELFRVVSRVCIFKENKGGDK